MPVFVDIDPKADEQNGKSGLPDIAKYIYAKVNGDSSTTGHLKDEVKQDGEVPEKAEQKLLDRHSEKPAAK